MRRAPRQRTRLRKEPTVYDGTQYADFPLLHTMITNEKQRTQSLEIAGCKQIKYTKSNDGWMRTIFVLEGRALDKFLIPFLLVTVNAVAWTVTVEVMDPVWKEDDLSAYESYFGLVLNTSLAFLLVFRLNRSATRYWSARQSWGIMIALSRTFVSGLLVHGDHDPVTRDDAIRWSMGFSIAIMQLIRGGIRIDPTSLAGILTEDEIYEMDVPGSHTAIYAAGKVRWHLKDLFKVDNGTSFPLSQAWTQQLDTLEKQLNEWILQMGALERIRATPLPLVYVTHLRTFLLFFLLAMPYIWREALGYLTIPVVMVSAYALLGLEGAAEEVQAPFEKDRTNHLAMEAFCLLLIKNTQEQLVQSADHTIKIRSRSSGNGTGRSDSNEKPEKTDSSC